MAADPQTQNALSAHLAEVRSLFSAIGRLKILRIQLDSLGVAALPDERFAESAAGDLSHMTAGKLRRLLAALDSLDAVLVTPAKLDGVEMPPIKAIVDVIR